MGHLARADANELLNAGVTEVAYLCSVKSKVRRAELVAEATLTERAVILIDDKTLNFPCNY